MTTEGLGDQLLAPKDAARYCGVSTHTFYRWIEEKRFPVIRLERTIRIRRSELETYLRLNTDAG